MEIKKTQALDGEVSEWKYRHSKAENFISFEKVSPLCELYGVTCEGCPVKAQTGFGFCRSTPYEDYCDAENTEDRAQAAQRHINFLESLRKS